MYKTTINIEGHLLNVVGVHLSSNNYDKDNSRFDMDSVSGLQSARYYFTNYSEASKKRCFDIGEIIRDSRTTPSTPTIIMGDFNDVCGTKSLKLLGKAGFKDAWWENGFGLGATIHCPVPLRINHIFYNNLLEVVSKKKVKGESLSDHDALVASYTFSYEQ